VGAQPAELTVGDRISYPSHGVGRIQKIDEQEFEGLKMKVLVVAFDQQKTILRVPLNKATALGMRKLLDG
jgi:CarD family transcriptional regulator